MEERPSIVRLPEEVIGKIAAGEVVESPAAAIKELIENSIDAGATSITVETREGGIAYFRVSDNGAGIPPGDIRMAFERHATSKIRHAEDLFDVRSLGFRGEALASIAAVSKVTLTTRTGKEERGTKAVNVGGQFQQIQDAPNPEGTTIVVQDLFFNTPARLKFLKKPTTEGARVADMVLRMILSNPQVSFRLIQNEKQVYYSPGDGKLKSAIYSIYGRTVVEGLREVSGRDGGMEIQGYVGAGATARGNRTHQSFFINGRYVRSPLLTQALESACRERMVTGQFPLCMLHIRVPNTFVDVNVHPNKLEVRFSDEKLVLECVERIIQDALTNDAVESAPKLSLNGEERPQRREPPNLQVIEAVPSSGARQSFGEVVQDFFSTMPAPPTRVREASTPFVSAPTASRALPFADYPQPNARGEPSIERHKKEEASPTRAEEDLPILPYRVIGVAFHTYVFVEQGDKVLIIDQHAAHERIVYEKLMHSLSAGEGSQQLLVAQVVSLSPTDMDRLHAYEDAVRGAGFEFGFFGDDAVQVRAVPMILGEPEAKNSFLAVVDRLGELRMLATKEKRREAIVQMSCKRAVKGGDVLQPLEIESLLREMQQSSAPPTCPHGRPLVVVLAKSELEKRFKRIV